MKKLVIFFGLVISFNLLAHNEVQITNHTSEIPEVLFIGLANHLQFSHAKITKLKIGNEEIEPTSLNSNEFLVNVTTSGPVMIEIYSGTGLIQKKEFKAERVSAPEISLSGVKVGQPISILEIIKNPKLEIFMASKLKKSSIEIVSFSIVLAGKEMDMYEGTMNSNTINSQFLNQISNLKVGDIILIESVNIKGPDKTIRKIPGLSYKIRAI